MDSSLSQQPPDPKTKKTDRLPVVELRPVEQQIHTVLRTVVDQIQEKKPEPQLVLDPGKNKNQMKPVKAIWKGNELLEVTTNRSRAISGSVNGVRGTGGSVFGRLVHTVACGCMWPIRSLGYLFGRRKKILPIQDVINATSHCFTDIEYTDRWGLVEFGVTCPRCEKAVAAPWQFDRIVQTNAGEGIFCPGCGALLLASPVTEKEEHKLPYTKELETFSRKRHPLSPYTSEEASKIRMAAAAAKADPLSVVQKEVEQEQQKASKPPVQVLDG